MGKGKSVGSVEDLMEGDKVEYGVEEVEFHHRPVLKLYIKDNERFQMLFGVQKAKMIVDNLPAIREFITKNDDSHK